MKILADENVDRAIVDWLIQEKHEVSWLTQRETGANDLTVAALASLKNRILITFDRDFGELVFGAGITIPGVVFLRLRSSSSTQLISEFAR